MSVQQQQALDSLYALDNVLTIKITMPQADWDAVRTEEPAGGRCNFNWKGGDRYTWSKTTSVEISGTSFPARTTFTQVGIKKKSFCGSVDSEKPCLHLDFGKFSDANVPVVEGLIGSRYVTLNNSVQDNAYIRQPLGYKLLGMAGLPHSRCNFAPGVCEWSADWPRVGRRQQSGYLCQCRSGHEALYQAQFQWQYERQSVRNCTHG